MSLFSRKSIDQLQADAAKETADSFKRVLGPWNLISMGIGAIIGTGIFVLTGVAAAQYAGPAIVYSFLLAGAGCVFAGLCYAEFAAMIPVAGSAYTYGYATLGEFIAWIIGWDLMLEYMFGAATVAVGWSGYVNSILRDLNIHLPPAITNSPGALVQLPTTGGWVRVTDGLTRSLAESGTDISTLPQAHGVFNLVAALGIAVIAFFLVLGIKESARFNNVAVIVKVTVVLLFIAFGGYYLMQNMDMARDNWDPFVPANTGPGEFGFSGVVRASGVIFFAYIGFDAVSTTAQEAKNPQKDMPIGILGSLLICTVLYILVSAIMTGIVPYPELNVAEPIAVAIDRIGMPILSGLVKLGAIAGLTSVLLVLLLSQPRVFYSMAKDGLLPPVFSRVHPKFRTPYVSTLLTGAICATIAGLVPINILGELVSIGTLLAFVIVCGGVWYLRVKEPNRARPFKTPLVPLVPILGILVCGYMMYGLPGDTWLRLLVWLAIGFVVYFAYSRHHSVIARSEE